jgi:hypothetical protein
MTSGVSVVTTAQPHAIGAPAGRGLPSEEDVCGTVSGHEILPTGGHENSPVAATSSPQN